MQKIILKDNSEIIIHEGASLSHIVTDITAYSELEELAKKLTKENLAQVKFQTDELITGVYTHLVTLNPLFQTNAVDDKIEVTFGFREMTEQELQYELLAAEITNTEMALCDVYELIAQ